MKKIVSMLVLLVAMTACESKSKSSSYERLGDVTDLSRCDQGYTNSPYGSWDASYSGNIARIDTTISISSNYIHVVNTCTIQGEVISASAAAPIDISGNRITILDVDSSTEYSASGSSCRASISRGSIGYSYRGSCLTLSNPDQSGETMTLVPTSGY